ncbi:cyclopropane fatty acyl phospholipid synthase [bacterium]|jgi:cyclopropane-fatty-acyl-phospholipid synthase|nr:cyclopropane fatty acyl phospholipid synthase [bacterium]
MKNAKKIIDSLLTGTGITINGPNAYDPQVHNDKFYARVLRGGSLALGEAYMDAWWDCEKLDQFFHKVLKADLDKRIKKNLDLMLRIVWNAVLNPGRKSKAFEVGEKHYDIGNDLYRGMLDKRLTYTCGYWKDAHDLDAAEEAKLDLICRKIGLRSGQKVLDIGSGWGSFIGYAAEKYDAHAIGYTISREQKELADEMYKNYSAETRLQDYRNINEKFDHVVSIGMFEHVGYKNYRTFMKVANKSLKDDGLFLLHTIAGNKSVKATDPWINKHIFPNSMLPSMAQIGKAIEGLFVIEDVHNFGPDYDKTLMAWFANFDKAWPGIKQNYSERFYRMWKYYLLSCAGSFRARNIQLWQIVLSKKGVANGYKSLR